MFRCGLDDVNPTPIPPRLRGIDRVTPQQMIVLFVHGMGRSPLSGWPLMRQLRRSGLRTDSFGYVAAIEKFEVIVTRLRRRIEQLAEAGPYAVVGHSLGGVLLRAALNELHGETRQPEHLFLLGSPITPSRLAAKWQRNLVFRVLAGDCGQLLGSVERMALIGPTTVSATGIAGNRGFIASFGPFGREPNDGLVSLSEVSASWLAAVLQVRVIHTLLPSSHDVSRIIARVLLPERPDTSVKPAVSSASDLKR
jgi:pimeloyl-ACP methyl ester carboxylesterase